MAYVGIGNRQDYVADFQSQNFSGDGSTTAFTLNYEAVTGSIRVAVDNVLQPADGSSYTCNGFTLNFSAAPASGTDNITVLFLGTVRNIASVSDGAIVTSKIADGAVTSAKLDSGKVLQVVSTTKTDTFSASVAGRDVSGDVTGLTVTITPTSASSKLLVFVNLDTSVGSGTGAAGSRIYRDGTNILIGDTAGSRIRATIGRNYTGSTNEVLNSSAFGQVDAGSTSATTFSVRLLNALSGTTQTYYINRSSDDSDTNSNTRSVSSIMVMEVSA